jgi:chemotaxis protein MotB
MSMQPHEHPAEHDAEHPAEHAGGHHGGHAKHKKGHGGHGEGGHGGGWIVTYSDMITLLMAFFICIITFASKETEKYTTKKDSLIGNGGGSGIASSSAKGTLEHDSVVWRLRVRQARVGESGAEMSPMYRDPSPDTTAHILQALEGTAAGRLRDNFAIRLPRSLLFEKDDRLSSSGVRLLHALAVNLRDLPYDLQFQVGPAEHIGQAVRLCGYLASQEGYEPARLAVGGRPTADGDVDSIWLVLVRQF